MLILNPFILASSAPPPAQAVGDPYFHRVSSLLHMNGANGSTTYLDQTGKTWSVQGNAQQSTAEKLFGTASTVLDGVSEFITTANHIDFQFGSADFTIEMAVRLTQLPQYSAGFSATFYSQLEASTGLSLQFRTYPTNRFVVYLGSATEIGDFPVTLAINTWYRIALSRKAGVLRMFVDGVKVGSDVTSTHDFSPVSQGPQIGGFYYSSTYYGVVNGYIDELRISKGVGRYTANYTVDTGEFPNSLPTVDVNWSDVTLMLHADGMDGALITSDSSDSRHSVSGRALATVSNTQKKFGPTSLKFTGSGVTTGTTTQDAFLVPTTTGLVLGTGDFTLEGWVYLTTTPTSLSMLLDFRPASGNGAYPCLYIGPARELVYYTQSAARITGGTVPLNAWAHFAVSRAGSITRLFLNGVQLGAYFDVNDYLAAPSLVIGASGNNAFYGGLGGYLDEIRVTKGFARYATEFTPPWTPFPDAVQHPDPYRYNVALLLHLEGPNGATTFTDDSVNPKTSVAVDNAKLSTAWSKFGTASALFDGTGDYIRITSGATDLTFGTGDFTIEMTIKPSVVSAGNSHFLYDSRSGTSSNCPQLRINSGGFIEFLNGGAILITGTTTIAAGNEYVVAVSRSGTSLRLFINGVQEGATVTNSTPFTVGDTAAPLVIGTSNFNPAAAGYNGYIDEVRVTKGVARYTANYTPQTAAFPSPALPPLFDENYTFNDEGAASAGWTAANAAITTDGTVLRLTKNVASTSVNASMTKTIALPGTNKDFIFYGKVRMSQGSNHSGAIWLSDGTRYYIMWLNYNDEHPTVKIVQGAISFTYNNSGTVNAKQVQTGADTANNWTEFALQYDHKFGALNCFYREADGRWMLKGRVAAGFFNAVQVQVLTITNAPQNSWMEFDYLSVCRPNLMVIGDSIPAGETLYNPNLSLNKADYTSTWARYAKLYPALRNNLVVNKGVGSESSTQTLARITDVTDQAPKVVFLHASTNDQVLGVSSGTRTTNITNSVNAIEAAGAQCVLLNAMYGTSSNSINPAHRDYMKNWWDASATSVGSYGTVDIMTPLLSGGYMADAKTQSDKIHPNPTGHQGIGELIAAA